MLRREMEGVFDSGEKLENKLKLSEDFYQFIASQTAHRFLKSSGFKLLDNGDFTITISYCLKELKTSHVKHVGDNHDKKFPRICAPSKTPSFCFL